MHVYLWSFVHSNTPTEIVKHPQETTVDLEKNATFTCEISGGDYIKWRVNGSDLTPSDDIKTDRVTVGNNDLYTLTIFARNLYNGTTIQFVTGVFGGDEKESDIVTLKIRGITCSMCTCTLQICFMCAYDIFM